MTIRLWAPLAGIVSIVVDGVAHPMIGSVDGWWTVDQEFGPGHDYGFLLDDDPSLVPDPRSVCQPYGVHGPSRTLDLSDFEWADHQWTGRPLAGSVLYELHIGTFTPRGTLRSAIDKLDHLVDLGVDAVELMPVNSFNGERGWGYDGVLWFAVDESYGGPRAYQTFVDACHRRGLAVVQDVVYNHLGPSGNHLPRYGPYLHDGRTNTWGASINLDEPEVRRYIIDNALMWLRDFHVDGLRLDAVHALVDSLPTHILRELADEVEALATFERRPLYLIAESDLNDPILITPREAGGYGLDAQWSDDYHHALHVALTGETFGYYADFERLDALAKVYTHGFFHDGTYSSFRGHDHGKPIDTAVTAGWRLVVTNQNHDQVGNRAAGDRPSEVLDAGQLAIAAVLTLTSPFTPMLFMGEEWGSSSPFQFFTAHPEPELGRATAEGRLAEFEQMGWDPDVVPDPQDPDTFRRSKLDWGERNHGDHARLLALYRELIALRRTVPELVDPRLDSAQVDFDDDARWMIVRRPTIAIAANFGPNAAALSVTGEVLLATSDDVKATGSQLVLPGHSAAIVWKTAPVVGRK